MLAMSLSRNRFPLSGDMPDCLRSFARLVVPEQDVENRRVVIAQQFLDQDPGLDLQRAGPAAIAVGRDLAAPAFDLGDEGVIIGADQPGELALGEIEFFPPRPQPCAGLAAQRQYVTRLFR